MHAHKDDCPVCDVQRTRQVMCDNCEHPFDPVRFRWRCPDCGWKMSCCEGAPA